MNLAKRVVKRCKLFFAALAALLLAFAAAARAQQTATITVDASKTILIKPLKVGGTNILSHAANNFVEGFGDINFIADARAARVSLIRTNAFPDNKTAKDLRFFDGKVRAILRAGAQPLLIQYINPALAAEKRFLTVDGKPGGTIESNAVFLVRHYTDLAGEFKLPRLYLEIGNEPDLKIDYQADADEYADIFNRVHAALIAANLREKAVLLGPAIAYGYRQPFFYSDAPDSPNYNADYVRRNRIIERFIERCSAAVDIVTYHTYSNENTTNKRALDDVLSQPKHLETKEQHDRRVDPNVSDANDPKSYRGIAALLDLMKKQRFARNDNQSFARIGVTEFNAGGSAVPHTVEQGLWNLALTAFHVKSPYSVITNSFVFDDPENHENFGLYNPQTRRQNYAYWALWMRNNLTGAQVLEASAANVPNNEYNNPLLLVTATRDASTLYLEVINRAARDIRATINLTGARFARSAKVYRMATDALPDKSESRRIGARFEQNFSARSATVFAVSIQSRAQPKKSNNTSPRSQL